MDKILLDLRHAPFSHGQAYVVISRLHLATDCSVYVNDGYCAERNGRPCAVLGSVVYTTSFSTRRARPLLRRPHLLTSAPAASHALPI